MHSRFAVSLLLVAALAATAGAQVTVTDPAGDAIASPAGIVSPDLVAGSLRTGDGTLIVRVDYAKGTWNPQTTLTFIALDVDQNPETGHPGTTAAGVTDRDILGTDYFISVVGSSASFLLAQHTGCVNCFRQLPVQLTRFTVLGSDSFELELPLSAIGKQDANINFKVTSTMLIGNGNSTSVLDFMPDADRGVATAQPVRFFTATPSPIRKGQTTTLRWATLAGTNVTIDNGIGTQPPTGSVAVKPDRTTTYTLFVVSSGATRTAQVTVEVAETALLVVTAMPNGIVAPANAVGGSDRVVVSNIGGASINPAWSVGVPFSLSNTGPIAPGESRTVIVNAEPRPSGFYTGTLTVTGGSSLLLSIPLRLLSAQRPVGTVVARAAQNRVDVAAAPTTAAGSTVAFTNGGSAQLRGMAVADQPWVTPESGVITIEPGATRLVSFTVDPSRRSAAANGGSEAATISLNYINPLPATASEVGALDDANSTSVSTTMIYTPKPTVTAGAVPALAPGQVAHFIPGMVRTSSFVTDFFALNRQSTALLPSMSLIFTPTAGPALSQTAALGTVQPNTMLGFSDILFTVFGSTGLGSLQARTADVSKVSLSAAVLNTASALGNFGTALVAHRSDRSADNNRQIVLPGLRSGDATTFFLQEVSGTNTNAQINFYDASGSIAATSAAVSVPGFGVVDLNTPLPATAVTAVVVNTGQGRLVTRALATDASGDVTPLEDWNLRGGIGTQRVVIPYVRRGSTAKTELVMTSYNAAAAGTLEFRSAVPARHRAVKPAGTGAATASSRSISIGSNSTLTFPDILADLGVGDAAAGALIYTPTSGAMPSITARANLADAGVATTTALPVVPATGGLVLAKSQEFSNIEDASPATAAKKTRGTIAPRSAWSRRAARARPSTSRSTSLR